MTQKKTIKPGAAYCIDWSHLCSGNDYESMTEHFKIPKIIALVNSVEDTFNRKYLIDAVRLQHLQSQCVKNPDVNVCYSILRDQTDLEERYNNEKQAIRSRKTEAESITEVATHELDSGKVNRFSAREIAVLFIIILEKLGVYLGNDSTKNCNQNVIKSFLSKITGYKEETFNQKLTLDIVSKSTINAMYKIANEIRSFLPSLSKEIVDRVEKG